MDQAAQLDAFAARWDLTALQAELDHLLKAFDPQTRPYVLSHLALSLDMFLDAYGPGVPGGLS